MSEVSANQPVAGASPAAPVASAPVVPKKPKDRNKFVDFFVRLFKERKLGAASFIVCIMLLLIAIFADFIAPFGPNDINPIDRLQAPSAEHWFGTDHLGRDLFSRIVHGAQLSVIIAFAATTLSIIISAFIGIVSGYIGGRTDTVTQRLVDGWMTFPELVILIVAVSVFGPSPLTIITVLGLLMGVSGSRVVRGAVLSARENVYVYAAQSIGASTPRILWYHILPNIMAPVIILFTTRLGVVILLESTLSFLGLGVPPPAPAWGSMLSLDGRTYMFQGPWLAIFPGIAITVVVFAINIFGDAMRDLLDPRMRGGGGRFMSAVRKNRPAAQQAKSDAGSQ